MRFDVGEFVLATPSLWRLLDDPDVAIELTSTAGGRAPASEPHVCSPVCLAETFVAVINRYEAEGVGGPWLLFSSPEDLALASAAVEILPATVAITLEEDRVRSTWKLVPFRR